MRDGLPLAEFAFLGPLRDQLVEALLDTKTTTRSLIRPYEVDEGPPPTAGDVVVHGASCRAMNGVISLDPCATGDPDPRSE